MKESRYNVWTEREGSHYVYNGVSGALLRVSEADYGALGGFLGGAPGATCRPALLADMARGRMLIPDELDERDMLSRRYQTSRYATEHFALTLVTSLGCNFDCPYCFEAKHPSIMNAEVEHALLRLLDDKLPTISSFHASWFGGEPLVGKQPLLALSDAFIARCDRHEVAYTADIITNGYFLDAETAQQLAERRVGSAQITLDGPPETHDRMRPLIGGQGTFWRILDNVCAAREHMEIAIRINVDTRNFARVEELLQILVDRGLAGQVHPYIGHLVGTDVYAPAPSASYGHLCFSNRQFAQAELEFAQLAERYGFTPKQLPGPSGTPCTAVRANELVVGSYGELYKCWESVGNPGDVIGNIRDYENLNGRLHRWLQFDPFGDEECRSCIALPTCMGGCAHHAMDPKQYDNRCSTFRHTYKEQVLHFVDLAERAGQQGLVMPTGLAHRMDTR